MMTVPDSLVQREIELKIFYLFIHADGVCDQAEMERFDALCQAMEMGGQKKEDIVSYCEGVLRADHTDQSEKAICEMKKLFQEQETSARLDLSAPGKAFTIWTLINLGYADTEYTEPEKKIVRFLVEYWNFSEAVMEEMLDIAETILALTQCKEWAETAQKPQKEIDNIAQLVDRRIQRLTERVENLIANAEIILEKED